MFYADFAHCRLITYRVSQFMNWGNRNVEKVHFGELRRVLLCMIWWWSGDGIDFNSREW
jgi:hypothetical protein